MTVAAVPHYLGQKFSTASPGDRFFAYLPAWTDRAAQEQAFAKACAKESGEAGQLARAGLDAAIDSGKIPKLWTKFDAHENEDSPWRPVLELNADDKRRMQALSERQNAIVKSHSPAQVLVVEAESTSPFVTGLGLEHPLENGFAFLMPYGLPYLAGSGLKGVLRAAARELSEGLFGGNAGWNEASITALFGMLSADGDTEHRRGALIFHDCMPNITSGRLRLDVMTPHQNHYFQQGKTPHDSGQPNPINFLTVPPGSHFRFVITCHSGLLNNDPQAATLLQRDASGTPHWQQLMRNAMEHAFAWLGFGAKTAVGYGAMRENQAERKHREQTQRKAAEEHQRQQESHRQEAEARQRAQAEQDRRGMLSENGRTLEDVQRQIAATAALPAIARGAQEADLRRMIKPLLDTAATWPEADRETAARQLEAAFELLGWFDAVQKDKKKRQKQEDKKREQISAIRAGVTIN